MKYAVLVLGLLAALCTNAQNHLKDFALQRSLKQDGLQLNFTVLDDDKKGIRHHNPSKFYYWTKSQHLRATQGASSGDLLHGEFEAFYQSKQLSHKGTFDKGLKHGTWNFWNEDGVYIRTEHWRHGRLCGKQKFYDTNGQLTRTEIIRVHKKKSIQSDTVIVWKLFDRKTIVIKDSLGRTSEIQNYKRGRLHGISKCYEKGKLKSKTKYKKGEEVVQPDQTDSLSEQQPIEPAEELDSNGTNAPNNEEIKEPNNLKKLWQKWFGKEKEKKSKDSKEREKKDNSKDKAEDAALNPIKK